ncbi:CPBP family intramembrane glutamic endopeptidase [Membranihabitans marinus]|uniref:CPBP family intramembrane glutamic endopeptidase n=1 Tax=Membranihabitans marinus TaxID=1227546 RepID=UPI001F373106|nr:CPBP family intramembrane glutamic endopeptidase [Membranihabitans marinus]
MKKEWTHSIFYTILLTVIWLFVNRSTGGSLFYLDALFFVALYFLFFTYGKPATSQWLKNYCDVRRVRILFFPTLLLVIYYIYGIIHGQPIFDGPMLLVPFLVYFPSLMVSVFEQKGSEVHKSDMFTLWFFLFPITLVDLPFKSNLPIDGVSLESVFRMVVMLASIHAFVVLRGLKDVGFFPEFSWKKLATTTWVWLLYIGVIFAVGFAVKFIQYAGYENVDWVWVEKMATKSIKIFFHTAIFEELFFRGYFQNMLCKQLDKNFQHKKYWLIGSVTMVAISLLTGYGMEGSMQWFPALVSVIIMGFAYYLAQRFPALQATYLGMAIASIVFGLVHFHSGSIIFVGFASVAGWAYGYVYYRTKNVFYAALIHTLVNSSAPWFGLELMK